MGKLVDKNIFLVVPKIVEQPTWGGDFILDEKGWLEKKPFADLKIGQSYELYSGSLLRSDLKSSADKHFTGEFSGAKDSAKSLYRGNRDGLIPLAKMIEQDPVGVLGSSAAKKGRGKLNLLIKFTQASGNSFQIHIGQGVRSAKWRAKPESWYYFLPGLVTLGLKDGTTIKAFQKDVVEIDNEMRNLSNGIKNGHLKLHEAKRIRERILKKFDPWKYVNRLTVRKDEVIDLSRGGLHHSWEDDSRRFPHGNVVYELQCDVMDPVSTIRCFDKGKFKANGSLRQLDIHDYFKHLKSSPAYNQPEKYRHKPKRIFSNSAIKVESLISSNPFYDLERLTLKNGYEGKYTDTKRSFHHLFVKSGAVIVAAGGESLTVTRGHSCFIAARAGHYRLTPPGKRGEKIEILKTYIS